MAGGVEVSRAKYRGSWTESSAFCPRGRRRPSEPGVKMVFSSSWNRVIASDRESLYVSVVINFLLGYST